MSELSDPSALVESSMSPYARSLLAHAGWVRNLACSIVRDPNLADDLVQETWVRALQHPPTRGSLRAWLATVVRNLALERHRAESRRHRHEAAGSREDLAPATSDLIEQVSTEKHIVGLVLSLVEPYRTAVLMRYYEALAPRKIAAQLGVPVSTVHTRISRGLDKLRRLLDEEYGERRTWMLALIPSIQSAQAAYPLLGAAVMKSKMFVATSVAALLVGTVVAWPILTAPAESPSDGTDTPTVTGAGVESRDKGSAQPGADDRRTLAPKTPAAAKEGDPQAAPVITIRGRLVDADAAPLAGRTVGFTTSTKWSLPDAKSAPTQTTRTADRGRFELEIPTTTGRIKVHDTGWRTVLAAVMDENPQREALVVAAPVIPLAGKVVDEAGRAVVDAAVQIVLPASFFTRFDDVHDTATDDFLRHRSGGDGSFEIADACFIDKADLEITKPGFRNLRVRLPRAGNPSLVVRLKRTDSADNTITGQVLDQRGQVVADAWVTLGRTSTKSDDQGNFALELPKSGPADTLMAIKRGSLPARLKKVDDASNWPTPVVLRLGGPPLSIAGRVLDAAGNGVPSVKVWVYDGEFAGRVDQTTSTVQGLVTGGATRSVVMRMIREGGQEPRDVLRRTPTAMWPFTRTTASGAFRIDGLGKRNYALRAILDDTLLMVEKAGVAGGSTGVVLQFAKDSYYPKLSGIVISKKGHPIADAEIYTMCDPARVAVRNGGSTTQHQTAQNTRTDEAGRFEFQNVPRRLVYLRVDHKDVLSVEYGRSNEGGLAALVGNNTDNMVIEVQVRIHVNITVHDPAKADSFSALDAAGKTLPINQFKGKSRRTLRRQPLHDGKSGVVVVPETATRLVFYKGKTKVDEIDIDLVPGRVNEIQR